MRESFMIEVGLGGFTRTGTSSAAGAIFLRGLQWRPL